MRTQNRVGLLAVLAVGLALGCLASAAPRPVEAHPADMYAQNLAVTMSPQALQLDWQILPGPFLADAVWAAADLDQSGQVSSEEAAVWTAPFIAELSVRLDDEVLAHQDAEQIHWPTSVEVMRTAEDRISFGLEFDLPQMDSGSHPLEIHAAHLEANCLNWFSAEATGGLVFDDPMQENGSLHVEVYAGPEVPATSRSAWNSGTPNVPALSAIVSQAAAEASSTDEPESSATGSNPSVTDTLTGLVKTQEFTPLFLGSAFLLSLVLGSLHALTPGHGKALVGAYLVGSQGRTRDAVFLGAVVTMTHTGSVVLLGLVTLFASHYILPALIAPWLEIISGILVIGFGLNLLFQRGGVLRRWLARGGAESGEADHAHDHVQGHSHEHGHGEAHQHSSRHEHHDHTHGVPGHTHGQPAQVVTMRSLLTLGISGGLVPCPDAIAILLVAVAVNRIPFGMLLILAFSIGLALVLIGIGVAMVNGVRLIARGEVMSRFATYAPVISALVVTALGAGLTVSAVKSLQFGSAVVRSAAEAREQARMPMPRLLYIAADSTGRDQLSMQPLGGGEPVQYTNESMGITGYSLSPDGATIVYTTFQKEGGTAIWAIDAAGENRRLVLDCPTSECNSPSWYADGQKLAYERLDDATEVLVPRFSIWWLDLVGGETRPMFQDSAFASHAPQFSPDGKWLSYVSSADNTLVIFDLMSGESRFVPLGSQAVLSGSWSPDSDEVLFGSQAAGERLQMRTYALDSGAITMLGGPAGATDYYGAWSPNGEWIAIDRNVPLGGGINSNQVWLVRPDGTQGRAILDEPGASYSSLLWSPDSRQLLYARYVLDVGATTPGRFDIHGLDVESGETQLLVEGGDMPALLP